MGDASNIVIDGRLVKKDPNRQALSDQLDESFEFTPDSKHAVWMDGAYHYVIDGDTVAGYTHSGNSGTNLGVPNYQPVLQPDGSLFFFATRDRDKGTVTGSHQQAIAISPPLYRVTVSPGPSRDFGTTAAAGLAADNGTKPSQTNTPPNVPPNNQTQSNNPPQTTPPTNSAQTTADKARQKAQKTKDAADRLRGLFGH